MKIISVINYKGGVGKTTLTANLAAELAYRGRRVLLLDMDAQCSLTFSFITPDEWESQLSGDGTSGSDKTIKSWFDGIGDDDLETPSPGSLIVPNLGVTGSLRENGGRIDLIPSHLGLINVDLDLAYMLSGVPPGRVGRQRAKVYGLLRSHLGEYVEEAKYDVVLIDCPPNFNIVTKNAIVSSDGILIPAKPDYLSTLGIDYLLQGELRPFITFKASSRGSKSRNLLPSISEEELNRIQAKLNTARSREEGYRIVEEAFPLKERLFAFAKFLDLSIQKKDKTEKIREKIVTSTVGRRLSSEAIRGGYSPKQPTVAGGKP